MRNAIGSGRMALSLVLFAALAAPACSPLLGDVVDFPNGRGNSIVQGEIRSVDSRRGRIELRTDYGRTERVQYDRRTQVHYGNRQYPVTALERGDHVRMRVVYDRNGVAWADRVEVRSSVRDGRNTRGVAGRVERVTGIVQQVDNRRGFFTLTEGRNNRLVVHVPSRLSRDDARRFDRLRRGERVRVDVRMYDRNAAELVRFR